ncbi:hypothetical protein C3R44_21955, partial [Mycobacterium tuberculosis]
TGAQDEKAANGDAEGVERRRPQEGPRRAPGQEGRRGGEAARERAESGRGSEARGPGTGTDDDRPEQPRRGRGGRRGRRPGETKGGRDG